MCKVSGKNQSKNSNVSVHEIDQRKADASMEEERLIGEDSMQYSRNQGYAVRYFVGLLAE